MGHGVELRRQLDADDRFKGIFGRHQDHAAGARAYIHEHRSLIRDSDRAQNSVKEPGGRRFVQDAAANEGAPEILHSRDNTRANAVFAIEGVRNQLRAVSGPAAPRRIRDRPEPRRNAANQRQAADRPVNPFGAAHRRGGTCKTGAGHSARRRHVSTTRGAFTLTCEFGGLFPCTRPHCHLGPRQHGGRRYARAVFLEVPARSSGADPARGFLVAAALYLGGSLGCELIAGRHFEQQLDLRPTGRRRGNARDAGCRGLRPGAPDVLRRYPSRTSVRHRRSGRGCHNMWHVRATLCQPAWRVTDATVVITWSGSKGFVRYASHPALRAASCRSR